MATVPYDYIHQDIVATALIQPLDNDSFYNPVPNGHTGFAADGILYNAGEVVLTGSPPVFTYASWFTEFAGSGSPPVLNPYRGDQAAFPASGLILLSPVALTILDQSNTALPLWMQFLLNDSYALANNFSTGNPNYSNQLLDGWLPAGLTYADGIISVIYTPDPGAYQIEGLTGSPPSITGPWAIGSVDQVGQGPTLVVSIDFSQDEIYLDTAVDTPPFD